MLCWEKARSNSDLLFELTKQGWRDGGLVMFIMLAFLWGTRAFITLWYLDDSHPSAMQRKHAAYPL